MRPLFVAIMLSALLTAPALACGPSTNGTRAQQIPPLAALLDDLLPNAKLADAEMENLKALRAKIAKLAAGHKMQEARAVEEQAMKIIGYRKVWLRCGPGTFLWMKLPPKIAKLTPGEG
jgi:hypothetical protein